MRFWCLHVQSAVLSVGKMSLTGSEMFELLKSSLLVAICLDPPYLHRHFFNTEGHTKICLCVTERMTKIIDRASIFHVYVDTTSTDPDAQNSEIKTTKK